MANEKYGLPSNTVQVSTGNVATVNDSAAQNPLGSPLYYTDSVGRVLIYRYVQLNGTGTAATTNCPGVVYWKNNQRTIVTPTASEAIFNGINAVAGLLLNTAATNLYYVFIQTFGYVASAYTAASTAIGDALLGNATAFLTTRVAAGTAPTNRVVAWALTAVASTKSDFWVVSEFN